MSEANVAYESDKEESDENEGGFYGEGDHIVPFIPQDVSEFRGESEGHELEDLGEYDEAKKLYLFAGEATAPEYPSVWGEYEGSVASFVTPLDSEIEETEEEKENRREVEVIVEQIKHKIMERLLLRRRNAFLQKKLVELFRKRRMDSVLKEEPKGLDLESKYLKRLFAFREFKMAQESEIEDLTKSMQQYESDTKNLEQEIEEKLKTFVTRAKEVSVNLIYSRTGKKINEKTVDRLLRRLAQKHAEKGSRKLCYIKIKKQIEEKEQQLKAMQYFGDGLHISDYEQMKIDNQNYTDKIEEKEDELAKLRVKTQEIIQNLAHVREKAYAVEGDIELMSEKVFEVERTLVATREAVTNARMRRDNLREEYSRLKSGSGLLTRSKLLMDFELSIAETSKLHNSLKTLQKLMSDKHKQETELAKIIDTRSSRLEFEMQKQPKIMKPIMSRSNTTWRR